MIKQADILRAVFRSCPDLRCIEGHRWRPLPFFAGTFLLAPSRTANFFTGAGRFVVDRDRRYVRIRLHLRLAFLGQFVKSPRRRSSRTYPSIQAMLSDSHIDDFCPRGADFREEGVLRSKARAARPSAGPRVPPPRRLARSREPPPVAGSLVRGRVWVALPRTSLHFARYLPSRACSPLAGYRVARLPGPGGAIVLSQRHARSFPLAAVPLSHLAPAISMARNSRSTSRFQLCRSPNENAEVPAAFRNGHFECELSVGISLVACSVTLMAGSTCVRGVLARRTESSGKSRQIQPVRRCGRAH